jgi:hypothetical protein
MNITSECSVVAPNDLHDRAATRETTLFGAPVDADVGRVSVQKGTFH